MNRLEIASKLFGNHKLKAINNLGRVVEVAIINHEPTIVYTDSGDAPLVIKEVKNETWKIIKPNLKEFDFAELFYTYATASNLNASRIISMVSGLDMCRPFSSISLDEYRGKWTISGVYEDE